MVPATADPLDVEKQARLGLIPVRIGPYASAKEQRGLLPYSGNVTQSLSFRGRCLPGSSIV
jgi:hypothetical protein